MVEILVHRKHYRNHSTSILFLILNGIVGILIGTTPFVDNWAHLGGLIGGFCLALALRLTHRGLQRSARCGEFLFVAVQVFWFLLVGAILVAGFVGLFIREDTGANDCSWCKHITCVETDWWDCDVAIIPPDDAKCSFDIQGDLTTTITCPSVRNLPKTTVRQFSVQGYNETVQLTDISQRNLDRYCDDICDQTAPRATQGGNRRTPQSPSPGSSGIVFVPSSPEDDYASSLEQGNIERSNTE